ncbi:hypothetical protein E2562_012063 [Oryza meyeriana var. granulata]|uniref:Uncharacterized protein n=1 Tax=Oryza meyeriana var. granulata TaxID=110450 RepID=A0A6G1D4H1_9ORYZ|nr:hypothetical protein E2562_012063 [Oryza meyeriana var. granulata]
MVALAAGVLALSPVDDAMSPNRLPSQTPSTPRRPRCREFNESDRGLDFEGLESSLLSAGVVVHPPWYKRVVDLLGHSKDAAGKLQERLAP